MSAGNALSQSAPGLVATPQATQNKLHFRAAQACPACQAELVPGAIFCVECGHALGCPCPQCGAEVGGCDFCESCGHWLKPGQCRFCYAASPEGAAFCTECGNSQQGLHCVRCHSVGFFDFCSGCGDTLSDLARELAQAPPDDPALAEALQQLRTLDEAARQVRAQVAPAPTPAMAGAAPTASAPRPALNLSGALQSMRAFSALDAAAAERARQQAVLDRQAAQAYAAAAMAQANQASHEQALQASRASEMAKSEAGALALAIEQQQARERLKALVTASASLTFADAQSARRHAMHMRELLAREGQKPTQWLCNWANCRHNMPNDCGNPTLGGVWQFD